MTRQKIQIRRPLALLLAAGCVFLFACKNELAVSDAAQTSSPIASASLPSNSKVQSSPTTLKERQIKFCALSFNWLFVILGAFGSFI